MKRGEIWLAQLDPTIGCEIQKTRPCVVVSPDEMNAHLRTVIVAPMTTGSRPASFRIPLTFQGKHGLIVLDQIRTLDRVSSADQVEWILSDSGAVAIIVETPTHRDLASIQRLARVRTLACKNGFRPRPAWAAIVRCRVHPVGAEPPVAA